MGRIKINFLYNSFIMLSSYVINIILFPYVARVLGVELVGKIGFVNNVISYFSLFALLGIPALGIREISACGDNREKRSEVFSNILFLLLMATGIVVAIYFVAVWYVERLSNDKELFFIGSFHLLSTSLLLEWFYQGIEDFRFIAIRTVAIKILYALSVFCFVRNSEDFYLYYVLTVAVFVVNATINILYTRNFVDISFTRLRPWRYLKPLFSLGVYKIVVSMYTTFNVIYIGFVCSDVEVGYYYTATKFLMIITGFIGAFTNVMLPRMSSLLSEGNQKDFDFYLYKSIEWIFSIIFPVITFSVIFAPSIISLFAGEGYEGAVLPMRVVMFNALLVCVAQIFVIQVLIPLKKDNVILICALIGAIAGILSNILLVADYGALGSAFVLVLAEISNDIFCFGYVCKKKLVKIPLKSFWYNIIGSLPIACLYYCLNIYFTSSSISLCFSLIIGALYYCIFHMYIYKESVLSILLFRYLKRSAT